MLLRAFERAGSLLPTAKRYPTERRIRGWLEWRRVHAADAVIVSFGKSGRTWLRVMISRLYQRRYGLPEGELIEFDNFHKVDAAIPRVFFTHDNYLRDYTRAGASKDAFRNKRVVLLVRHPADITVSQFHQWKHRMRGHKIALNRYPAPDDNLSLYDFTMGPSGLAKVITWLNEWAKGIDTLDNALVVRYEDLRADTENTFRRIADFLKADATDEQIHDAVEWARFENMKQREADATSSSGRLKAADVDNPDSFKARRAKVGGYQDDFDDEELARIEGIIAATLDPRFSYVQVTATREATP